MYHRKKKMKENENIKWLPQILPDALVYDREIEEICTSLGAEDPLVPS